VQKGRVKKRYFNRGLQEGKKRPDWERVLATEAIACPDLYDLMRQVVLLITESGENIQSRYPAVLPLHLNQRFGP
jgi:hypothetical protein